MVLQDKLVIKTEKKIAHQALTMITVLGLVLTVYLLWIKKFFSKSYVGIILQFIIGITIMLFFLSGIAILFHAVSTTPLAVLDSAGIWVRHFGFIRWDEIRTVSLYSYKKSPITMVAIYPHDLSSLSARANFKGRCILFWSKIIKTPAITISNADVPYSAIIDFSKQFLKDAF